MSLTGRKFRCISLEETRGANWNKTFTTNEIYDEVDRGVGDALILIGNDGSAWGVDKECFEIV